MKNILTLVLLCLAGCVTVSDVDRAAIHNAHLGAVLLRGVSQPKGVQPSYESAQDGLTGSLGRLDLKFNGPEIANSTATMPVPSNP